MMPLLLAHAPEHFGTYYEPFAGGGALFFALRNAGRILTPKTKCAPALARLNDANGALVNAYRVVRDFPEELIVKLRRKKNTPEAYLRERQRFNEAQGSVAVDQAARFIYLNQTCFNGLWRVNKGGAFNVPFGHRKNPSICDAPNLRVCSLVLRRVKVTSFDFATAVENATAGDFVFCDPPYLRRTETEFTDYTSNGFGYEDHVRLRDLALNLKARGVHVLISNSDTEEVRDLYAGFRFVEVRGRRSVGPTIHARGSVPDLLLS